LHQRSTQRLVLLFALAIVSGYWISGFTKHSYAQPNHSSHQSTEDNCFACHRNNQDEVIGLFQNSVHNRRRLSCGNCHGGDIKAAEKTKAHTQAFVGKPSADQILEMCGACHKDQLASLKASHHFHQPSRAIRVDCVQCHGAHTVGKLTGDSQLELTCGNCHGVEYLAELPSPIKQVIRLDDEIRNALRDLESLGKRPSDESARLRREFKQQVADFVHSTNMKIALQNVKKMIETGNELKKQLAATR
jgi:cytochrome c553